MVGTHHIPIISLNKKDKIENPSDTIENSSKNNENHQKDNQKFINIEKHIEKQKHSPG